MRLQAVLRVQARVAGHARVGAGVEVPLVCRVLVALRVGVQRAEQEVRGVVCVVSHHVADLRRVRRLRGAALVYGASALHLEALRCCLGEEAGGRRVYACGASATGAAGSR